MLFKNLPLSRLMVNPDNDRHGPQGNEQDAINWLFAEHGDKMVTLAGDIVAQGRVFDSPLVKADGKIFVVFDGNRRVACLKALAGSCSIPQKYSKQFNNLQSTSDWSPKSKISCQIEYDQAEIDQIISRRHNGTDGGKGQLRWDTRAKANHANRIGATNQYPIAEAIEGFLGEHGYPNPTQIARSTLFRLVNAKKRQRQFGVELGGNGTLLLSRPKNEVIEAFSRVADDIIEKRLTLKNVLNSEGVDEYMLRLEESGLVDTADPASDQSRKRDVQPAALKDLKNVVRSKARPKPTRDTLIPQVEYDVVWTPGLQKVEVLWRELQFVLKFQRAELSIPIVFRTLIQLLTDYAINKLNTSPRNTSLSARVRHVVSALQESGELDRKEVADICTALGNTNSMREIEILHRAVHSSTVIPGRDDLIAMWGVFEKYLLSCCKYR